MKSSSVHRISADGNCSLAQRLANFIGNGVNCLWPTFSTPTLQILPWRPTDPAHSERQDLCSPARLLSDAFLEELNWPAIRQELGSINVCDLGCGSGSYYQRMLNIKGCNINKYDGIDIAPHANWPGISKVHPEAAFHIKNLNEDSSPIPEGSNLLFSQSAFEHIENDLLLFQRIAEYAKGLGRPVLQIHVIPSRACYYLYLSHGVRQYMPRSLEYIWQHFKNFSDGYAYALGNPAISRFHFRFITWPQMTGARDRRQTHRKQYLDKRTWLLRNTAANQHAPSFYALAILSNPKTSLDNLIKSNPA